MLGYGQWRDAVDKVGPRTGPRDNGSQLLGHDDKTVISGLGDCQPLARAFVRLSVARFPLGAIVFGSPSIRFHTRSNRPNLGKLRH